MALATERAVTKQKVLDYLKANEVQVEEVNRTSAIVDALAGEQPSTSWSLFNAHHTLAAASAS